MQPNTKMSMMHACPSYVVQITECMVLAKVCANLPLAPNDYWDSAEEGQGPPQCTQSTVRRTLCTLYMEHLALCTTSTPPPHPPTRLAFYSAHGAAMVGGSKAGGHGPTVPFLGFLMVPEQIWKRSFFRCL